MGLGVLFSGGKDSMLALYKSYKLGYNISCLINVNSENPYSYMFHTPAVNHVLKQARKLDIPLVSVNTRGEKETELSDLNRAISIATDKYGITGIVTGAVESTYQASRLQKICNDFDLDCFNRAYWFFYV